MNGNERTLAFGAVFTTLRVERAIPARKNGYLPSSRWLFLSFFFFDKNDRSVVDLFVCTVYTTTGFLFTARLVFVLFQETVNSAFQNASK